MQKKNPTVHLLILDPSQNDAEALVSLLRNAGRATRAHRITSEEDLEEVIKTGNWDLLLARDTEQEFSAEQALAMIRRMDKDIPFILMTSSENREQSVAFIKAGAQDTVPFDYSDLLVLKVNRELNALEERQAVRRDGIGGATDGRRVRTGAGPPGIVLDRARGQHQRPIPTCGKRNNAVSCCWKARRTPLPTLTMACTSMPTSPTWSSSATTTLTS